MNDNTLPIDAKLFVHVNDTVVVTQSKSFEEVDN